MFIRCKDRSCYTEWQPSELRDYPTIFAFRLPAPVLGTLCGNHFDTFLKRLEEKEIVKNTMMKAS